MWFGKTGNYAVVSGAGADLLARFAFLAAMVL
jgi:hypothetical protein